MISIKTIDETLKGYDQEIINSIIEVCKINSVKSEGSAQYPFGKGTVDCLEKTLEIARSLGFKTTNVDNYCGYAEIGEGDDIIGILSHLDVVPEGDLAKWNTNPYEPQIIDSKLYARGAMDDKGPAIASLYAVKALMDLNINFNKRVRLIFGLDEESGSLCMEHYVKHCEPVTIGFTPDGLFPGIHGEKGILQAKMNVNSKNSNVKIISFTGGNAFNSICEGATIVLDKVIELNLDEIKDNYPATFEVTYDDNTTTIKSTGVTGHGGAPDKGVNAISYLVKMLNDNKVDNSFIKEYSKVLSTDVFGETIGINLTDKYGNLTMNVGIIDITNDCGYFTMDIRYPISKVLSEVVDPINNMIDKDIFEYVIVEHKEPIYFELDDPLITCLIDAYQKVTNDMKTMPFAIGGGTYSRSMKNIVAFGGLFMGEEGNAHQPNENASVESIYKQARIYAQAVINLLQK